MGNHFNDRIIRNKCKYRNWGIATNILGALLQIANIDRLTLFNTLNFHANYYDGKVLSLKKNKTHQIDLLIYYFQMNVMIKM